MRATRDGSGAASWLQLTATAAASAVAIALFARSEWPWIALGFVALVPWLAALDRTPSLRRTLLAGLLMSEAYVLAVVPWLIDAMQDYTGAGWGTCLVVLVLIAPFVAPQFIALAVVRRAARRTAPAHAPWLVPLASTCAFVAADWVMPKLMADTLGLPLYGSPRLRQGADIAGVHGLTFLVLVWNECVLAIARALRARAVLDRRVIAPTLCLAALVAIPLTYGSMRLQQFATPDPALPTLQAALVQAGFSHYDRAASRHGAHQTVRTIIDSHVVLTREVLGMHDPDLLLWPETVYPLTFGAPSSPEAAAFDARLEEVVRRTGRPLVFGAYEAASGGEFNAAFFISPDVAGGTEVHRYRKVRLFPLTEWVPSLLDRPAVRARLPWLGTWSRGERATAVPVMLADGRTVRVAPLICYDAAVPSLALAGVRDGGELIVTLSNDSWFAYGNAPRLLLNISAFRSIETRRPQLRVTNTGATAVISPTGEVEGLLDVGQRGVLLGNVQPRDGTTLMLRLGDWFGPASGVVLLLLAGMAAVARRNAARPGIDANPGIPGT